MRISSLSARLLLLLAFIMSVPPALASCSAASFRATSSFPVGDGPEAVAVGDFNADGHPDLAVANSNTDNVSILLGTVSGSFTAGAPLTAGDDPTDVITADFNRDGKLDLAVANFITDNVSIFLGNGNGTFSAATNFATGNQPTAMVAGDFNNDGKLDLTGVRLSGTSIPVLIGDGAGGFAAPVTVSLNGSFGSRSIRIADFNLDGKEDLAVAAANSSNQGDKSYCSGTGPVVLPLDRRRMLLLS
jgi:hypothetical protein